MKSDSGGAEITTSTTSDPVEQAADDNKDGDAKEKKKGDKKDADPDEKKQNIGRTIGRLNHEGKLAAPISYSDVIESLVSLDLNIARRILRDLEENAETVTNPTAYVRSRVASAVKASSFEETETTKKIKQQVGWLNKHAGLQKQLSYTDVIEPLSNLDVAVAMSILKTLQTCAEQISNPTGYVVRAAAKTQELHEWIDEDPAAKKKISGYIGYLNYSEKLQSPLTYNEVAESLAVVGAGAAMKILRDLENNAAKVEKPTAYVLSAARRLLQGAESSSWNETWKEDEWWGEEEWGEEEWGDEWGETWYDEAATKADIEREVGWINRNVWLNGRLSYDVVEPLGGLSYDAAMQILSDLQENAETIDNPTAYVLVAAGRAKKKKGQKKTPLRSKKAATAQWGGDADAARKISKQVGWLNANAGLLDKLSYSDVAEPLAQLDLSVAMSILKDLQNRADKISNPTGYVVTAAKRSAK